MNITTIIGARPQFTKASMMSQEFHVNNIQESIIHTGQHFDSNMSNIFFEELDIKEPKYNLGIQNLSHGAMTGRQLEEIEKLLLKKRPDLVLVYGDTNSTLSGALSAVKLLIPVAHIEAGLRSNNRKMPEEINRIMTDHISELLYAPTSIAKDNLIKEGIEKDKVSLVGDVMYDSVLFYTQLAEEKSTIMTDLDLKKENYFLSTIHRQENTDDIDKLKNIINALNHAPYPVVLPLHPRTRKIIESNQIEIQNNIKIINPVGYLDMLILEKNAYKIITDSGGIQKEAYFFGVDCITLRNETEWSELVDIGVNILVGSKQKMIIDAMNKNKNKNYTNSSLYGNGKAAKIIVNSIIQFLS